MVGICGEGAATRLRFGAGEACRVRPWPCAKAGFTRRGFFVYEGCAGKGNATIAGAEIGKPTQKKAEAMDNVSPARRRRAAFQHGVSGRAQPVRTPKHPRSTLPTQLFPRVTVADHRCARHR